MEHVVWDAWWTAGDYIQLGCRRAGEEGNAQNIWDTINHLKVRRIDHGVHSVDDPALIEHLEGTQMPLTVCPLSNQKVRTEPPSAGR